MAARLDAAYDWLARCAGELRLEHRSREEPAIAKRWSDVEDWARGEELRCWRTGREIDPDAFADASDVPSSAQAACRLLADGRLATGGVGLELDCEGCVVLSLSEGPSTA